MNKSARGTSSASAMRMRVVRRKSFRPQDARQMSCALEIVRERFPRSKAALWFRVTRSGLQRVAEVGARDHPSAEPMSSWRAE
jgi:hypothetical protein